MCGNHAVLGGGGINAYYSPLIELVDSEVSANVVGIGNGGGIFSWTSSTRLVRSTIRANRAGQGGGMFAYGGQVDLEDCHLKHNSAQQRGGALYSLFLPLHSPTTVTLIDCSLHANAAPDGSAIYNWGGVVESVLRGSVLHLLGNRTSVRAAPCAECGPNAAVVTNFGTAFVGRGATIVPNDTVAVRNNANLTYVLPVPAGFHYDSAFKCEETVCFSVGTNVTTIPCPIQRCDTTRYSGQYLVDLPQGLSGPLASVPTACGPPSSFCPGAAAHNGTTLVRVTPGYKAVGVDGKPCVEHCVSEVPCPSGFWCSAGVAIPCPNGSYTEAQGAATEPRTTRAACLPCPSNATSTAEVSTRLSAVAASF